MEVSVLCVFYSNDKRQNAKQSGQRTTDKAQRENRVKKIPVGARFSVPVHTDPGTHPTSYTMGTGSLSLG